MEASDLIKNLVTNLARRGSSTYGPTAAGRLLLETGRWVRDRRNLSTHRGRPGERHDRPYFCARSPVAPLLSSALRRQRRGRTKTRAPGQVPGIGASKVCDLKADVPEGRCVVQSEEALRLGRRGCLTGFRGGLSLGVRRPNRQITGEQAPCPHGPPLGRHVAPADVRTRDGGKPFKL